MSEDDIRWKQRLNRLFLSSMNCTMTSITEQKKISQFSGRELSEIRQVISTVPEVQKAVLFGSRAKGCAGKGSDVDLAVFGGSLTENTIFELHEKLSEESDLPYFFDIVDYADLEDGPLKAHIDRVGISIFDRQIN